MFFLTLFFSFFLFSTKGLLHNTFLRSPSLVSLTLVLFSSLCFNSKFLFSFFLCVFMIFQSFFFLSIDKKNLLGSWMYFFIALHFIHILLGLFALWTKKEFFRHTKVYWHFLTGIWALCCCLFFLA
jgi:hypothetical protein